MKSLTSRILVSALLISTAGAVLAVQNWIKTKSKEGSVTVSTPPNWFVADDSDPAYKARVADLKKNNPKLAASMSGSGDQNQILRMMDGGDKGADGYIDNFNIVKKPAGGLTDAYFPQVGAEILKMMPFKTKGEYKVLQLSNGKALSYWGTMDIKTADGGKVGVDLLGFMFVKNDNLFVYSFGTHEGNMKTKKAEYEKIVKSATF